MRPPGRERRLSRHASDSVDGGERVASGDTDKSQRVAVVNESMARQLFGTTNVLNAAYFSVWVKRIRS